MQRLPVRSLALAAAAALATGACSTDRDTSPLAADPAGASLNTGAAGGPNGTYMILGRNGVLPTDLEARVQGAGGRVISIIPEIGVAFAEPVEPGFVAAAAGIAGVESVSPDIELQYTATEAQGGPATEVSAEGVLISDEASVAAASLGDDETFYSFQWAPAAVNAPEAWAAGVTGRGARVAIVDGAIYTNHLDLKANVDVAASASFVPGFAYNQDVGTLWHGTHVAGIVAARDNGIGTVGIAPNATLIGVKVLHNGTGSHNAILNGIMHSARPRSEGGAEADIINMSLGATVDYRGNWGSADFRTAFRELQKAYDRATRYAHQQGVTIISTTGNESVNYDANKNLFKFPAENQFVIAVSATGPIGWARGARNFSTLAYYSNFGKSITGLSGPGGNAALLVVNGDGGTCTVTGTYRTLTNACYAFDMIMSTVRGSGAATTSYNWTQGTSMAAPLVSGVAALIIERSGGTATPAQVRTALQRGATDLGKPGEDAEYGAGWVNALRSIQ
ncbi:MAG TPA: S8 family serine peptidase [Longimicrobium sp.]|nr:S8 family serine peptidase [Longimicrobium sp.]